MREIATSVSQVFVHIFEHINIENPTFFHAEYDAVVRFCKIVPLHHFNAATIWIKSEEKKKLSSTFGAI